MPSTEPLQVVESPGIAAVGDVRREQWCQQLQRGRQDVGEHQRVGAGLLEQQVAGEQHPARALTAAQRTGDVLLGLATVVGALEAANDATVVCVLVPDDVIPSLPLRPRAVGC